MKWFIAPRSGKHPSLNYCFICSLSFLLSVLHKLQISPNKLAYLRKDRSLAGMPCPYRRRLSKALATALAGALTSLSNDIRPRKHGLSKLWEGQWRYAIFVAYHYSALS